MDGNDYIKKAYESLLYHDFGKAIDYFKKAIALDPFNASFHHKLSITYDRSNKLDKAMQHAECACLLQEENGEYELHYNHLKAKYNVEEAEKDLELSNRRTTHALKLLTEAIKLDPLLIEAYLLMGFAHALNKNYELASKALINALNLNPDHKVAKQLLQEYAVSDSKYIH
ncbi:tetratricopeptide repeat protein [Longirhabdus pacifica]|uniref:tetratricopeptide repeat protein n=1 Tax=Longirhabdus pacifica TaxID=2305227 RepID=UPI0013E8AA85|nr:tetratricopeptide repeat protein [Longirhabdus pacifica]